ncbi:MAG: glutaredoxin family protein [Flavobacteriaceae bacterium]|nr:glutaredoxin family protein [Flavobacteriaceae bacterium]
MNKERLELYGTQWCMKSATLRNYLQSKWIEFDDFNVETDEDAANRVRALYDGKLKFPTLILGDKFLKNPTTKEMVEFLKNNN